MWYMPFTVPLPPLIWTRALPFSFANLRYEASSSVHRVASWFTWPSRTSLTALVEHFPSLATLLTALPLRSMAHGIHTNSSDSPLLWFSPPRTRACRSTSPFEKRDLSPLNDNGMNVSSASTMPDNSVSLEHSPRASRILCLHMNDV